MGCVMSLSYGGITRIRFRGFDLSPCIKAPLLVDAAKVNFFWFGENYFSEKEACFCRMARFIRLARKGPS